MSAKRLPKVGEVWVNGDGHIIGPLFQVFCPDNVFVLKGFNRSNGIYETFTAEGKYYSGNGDSECDLIAPWTDWQAEYERAKGLLETFVDFVGLDHVPASFAADVRELLAIPRDPDPQDDLCQKADYESKLDRETRP